MADILAVRGTAFYSESPTELVILEDILIFVNEMGKISRIVKPEDAEYEHWLQRAKELPQYIVLKEGQYLLPGFIDTHIHAPQFPQSGAALDVDLPTWLQTYTFPLEASFTDMNWAEQVYAYLVDTLLANGTTTAQYFGTVPYEANVQLAKSCLARKQRAFIGKVVMDVPEQCPPYYRDASPESALIATEEFIQACQTLSVGHKQTITGVITPRFIPTCSDAVLAGLGQLAASYEAPIQTHCSEGEWEHTYVKKRTGKTDTQALYDFGLLRERTSLAHSVFLSDEDASLYRETGASISHCPVSNVLFADGIAPIRKRLEQGVTVSLATDISGGYSPSMFDAMRQAILSSRTLEDGVDVTIPIAKRGVPNSRITFKEAFFIATTGGAKALGLTTGQWKEGYAFDALLFDVAAPHSQLFFTGQESLETMLQKIVFLGQRQNIIKVWVQGDLVHTLS